MQLTKQEISQTLGISTKTYLAYIQEKRKLPSDILIQMATLFQCSTDYLLGLSEQRTR